MSKSRKIVAFVVWLLAAVLAVVLTLLAVRYFFGQRDDSPTIPPPTQQEPIEPPKVEPAPVPKPKEVDKPKEPIKPPKVEPKAKSASTDDAGSGKIRLCPNSSETATIASDGRLLGHHPYANANASDLGASPAGFNSGSCSQLQGEAKVALEKLIAGARATDPAIGDAMIGVSCFRSSTYQREVFCRKVGDGYAVRARASAPPGYSEHATGYALDFGDRNNPQCNLSTCFSETPVGQWLAANAGSYGFVLSFPKGNSQGVMYEPWHWRYQGSGTAQATFAGAN
jgi:D-alanyl-D-alanine carboxypeptidase